MLIVSSSWLGISGSDGGKVQLPRHMMRGHAACGREEFAVHAVAALAILALGDAVLAQEPVPAPGDPWALVTRLARCQGLKAHHETVVAAIDPAAAAAGARRAEALDQLFEDTMVQALAAAEAASLPMAMHRTLAAAAHGRVRSLLAQEFKGAAEAEDGGTTLAAHVGMVAQEVTECEGFLADNAID